MTSDWRSYPFRLVPGDPQLDFPAAEGEHPDQESDTWFIAGQLDAVDTDRSFAFLTIFNKNRPGGAVVADFYTLALFDLDTGDYGTYTDYDMPPANLEPGAQRKLAMACGHLDIGYHSGAGTASWITCRDADGELLPYTYRISLVGEDHSGRRMRLDLAVTPTRAPTPVGASTYNGKIVCFGQSDTYSYFQTGMTMTGTLRWGDAVEQVSGSGGHVDRQWFPKYAGGGGTGGDPRARSHEWRTINFDNGVDLSIWPHERQCAAALYRSDDELSRPGDAAGLRRRPRGHRQQLRPVAERGASAGASACSGPVHAGLPPDHLRHNATGYYRGAAGSSPGAWLADRIHGRSISLSRNALGKTRDRVRVQRALAGAVPGLGAGRGAGRDRRERRTCRPGSSGDGGTGGAAGRRRASRRGG